MEYSKLNIENHNYLDSKIKISFKDYDNYKTKIILDISSENKFLDDRIEIYPIKESRKIINLIINAYQSVTARAEIYLNGENTRDRYPRPFISNSPISDDNQSDFNKIITGEAELQSDYVTLTQGKELLERGYYTLSYIQFIRSVEETITNFMLYKMTEQKRCPDDIRKYKGCPFGSKLTHCKIPDVRKLDTHLSSNPVWTSVLGNLLKMNEKRTLLLHYSGEASREEALEACQWVKDFRNII